MSQGSHTMRQGQAQEATGLDVEGKVNGLAVGGTQLSEKSSRDLHGWKVSARGIHSASCH